MPTPKEETTDQETIAPDAQEGNEQDGCCAEDDGCCAAAQYAKDFTGELKADHDESVFQATITTETVDRDGDVVLAKGLDFEAFLKNPVVLLGHPFAIESAFDLPVGKANWIKAKGRKVIAEVTPAPTEMGKEIFELIKGGFLNAVSIGFDPIDDGPPTEKELRARPEWAGARRIFRKAELVEFSIVNVPANPDALISAIRKGNLSMSAETLKHFGVEPQAIEPQPQRSIKRIVTMQRVVTMQPAAIVRAVPLTKEQIKAITTRTVLTARGRMVPA